MPPMPMRDRPGSVPGDVVDRLRKLPRRGRRKAIKEMRERQKEDRRKERKEKATERVLTLPPSHPKSEKLKKAHAARKR